MICRVKPPRQTGISASFLLLTVLVCGLVGASGQVTRADETLSPSLDRQRVDLESLDRIQRECLRVYPPELLAKMASGSREIPAGVEADPKAQMQFLDKEIPLDKGLFYPILLEDMLSAFERYISPGSRFLDLGSGDGRVVFMASLLGADAVGIEYDKQLVKVSRRARKALRDLVESDRARIIQGDFFESSWSGYDVIFFFDLSSFEPERVREKLRLEMDPGARLIVGFEQAPFPGLEVLEQDRATHPTIKVYRQPDETTEKALAAW